MPHNEQPVRGYHEGDALDLITTVTLEDGTVVDLTGASATWRLKEDIKDREILVEKTGTQGGDESQIEFTQPQDGELTVHLETGDTNGFIGWDDIIGTQREFYHELQVTDSAGKRVKGFHGPFEINL